MSSLDPDSTENRARWRPKHPVIDGLVLLGIIGAIVGGYPAFKVIVAGVVAWIILRIGVLMLGGMARPIPEPPPVGELRKVKIVYRCEICGTEVRMTVAPDQDPEPPRHCLDDMVMVTPIDDL
ncbi:MAG: hypothetical protein WCJ88_04315 [Actinomycetes bacterium]